MSSVAARKKARAQRKQKMSQKAQAGQSKTSYNDPREWRCERDKSGKGSAVLRFLEPSDQLIDWYVEKFGYEAEEAPFYVHFHTHGFKGDNGKWYIEHCPTSIKEDDCPICEANGELVDGWGGWDAVDDNHPEKKLVRNRKRKENYAANVLIISDPANPENEGKVKIFKYGKAIHDQIMAQLVPEFDDEEECDVSNFWDGRNFNLKIVKKDGYANYDKSTWGDIEPVGEDDEIDELLEKLHDLTTLVADDKYKSYDEMVKQFEKTQGKAETKRRRTMDDDGDDSGAGGTDGDEGVGEEEEKPSRSRRERRPRSEPAEEKPARRERKPEPKSEPAASGGDDDDDEYFASLLD